MNYDNLKFTGTSCLNTGITLELGQRIMNFFQALPHDQWCCQTSEQGQTQMCGLAGIYWGLRFMVRKMIVLRAMLLVGF